MTVLVQEPIVMTLSEQATHYDLNAWNRLLLKRRLLPNK